MSLDYVFDPLPSIVLFDSFRHFPVFPCKADDPLRMEMRQRGNSEKLNHVAPLLCCHAFSPLPFAWSCYDGGSSASMDERLKMATFVCFGCCKVFCPKSLCQVRSYDHTHLADRDGIRDSVDKKHQGSFGECTQSQSRGLGDYGYTHCDADESSFHSGETGDYYSIADESCSVDRILHSYFDVVALELTGLQSVASNPAPAWICARRGEGSSLSRDLS